MAKVEDAPDEAYIKPSPLPTARSYPAFLNKLRSMVDDPSTDELICWSPSGKSIFILHPVRFSEELLPRFFLHRRFSSFVRQLNMYGFHKVPHLLTGALEPMSSSPPPSAFSPTARGKDEEKEDNMAISAFHTSGAVKEDDHDLSEFLHEYFQRDRPDLMQYVVRKRPAPGTSEKQAGKKHPRPSSGPSASSSVITPPEDPLSLPPLPPMSAAGKAHSADTPSMSTSTALTPYFASPYAPPGVPPALFDAILTANGLQGNPTAAAFLAASLAPSPPEASPGEKEFFSGDGNGGAGAAGLNANVASVLQTLQATQNDLVREVAHLRTAQQRLWADREQARRKERQHQDALERILRFLGGVFGAPAIQAAGHGQAQGQGKDQFAHLGLQDELDRMTGDKRQRTSPASNRRRGLLIEGPAGWEGEPSPLGREQDEHRFESVGPEEFGSASRFERLGSPHEDDAAASVGASMTVPTSRPSTKPTPAAAPTLSPSRPATPRLTAKQRGDVMSALSTDQMSNWLAQLVNAAASPRLGSASSPAGAEGRAGEASCALSQTDTQARAMQRSLATLTESLRQSSQAHAAQTIDDHSDAWAQGVAALQSPLPPQSNTPGPALPRAPKSGEDDLFAQFLTDNTHDDDPDMVFTPYPAATPPG